MKLNRLVLLGAAVLTAFTLTACDDKKAAPQNTAAEKQYNIGVVQLVEHKALDEANKGFVDALTARGFKEGKNVKFDFQNAQADQSNLRNIAQRFTSNKVDLIGAIATPAAQTMANATKLLLSLPQLSPTLKLLNLSRKMISRALTSRDPPTWPQSTHWLN